MSAPYTYLADVSGSVVAAGSAHLGVLGVWLDNAHSSAIFFQLHNTSSADPAAAAVPAWVYRVPPTTSVLLDLGAHAGLRGAFGAGLAFGWSSTRDTYTAYGTAGHVACSIVTL